MEIEHEKVVVMNETGTYQDLESLLDRNLDEYGYELVHHELIGRENSRKLRLYIDAPGGITVDDCVFVSQRISRILDMEDPIPGKYTLEVSSPGIERPLVKKEHFENYVGHRIETSTMIKCCGRKKFLGTLLKVVDDSILMEVDGDVYSIGITNIRRSRLKPDWNTAH